MGKSKEPKHTEYYELVGCKPDATPEEIKKAYRKTALRLHPDRGGKQEDFQNMKNAYDVISDPNKRKMYDRYGPDVVKMMDGEMTNSMAFVANLRKRDRFMLVFAISFVSFILLLFPILLSIRWDALEGGSDSKPYAWAVAFIPLWVLEVLVTVIFAEQVRQEPLDKSDPEVDDDVRAMWNENERVFNRLRIEFGIKMGLVLIFEIFLVLQLDEVVDWSWYVVLLPMMLYNAINIVLRLLVVPDEYRAAHAGESGVDPAQLEHDLPMSSLLSRPDFYLTAILSVKWSVVLLATSVLCGFVGEYNAEHLDVTKSFYIAASPILGVIGLALAILLVFRVVSPSTSPEDEEIEQKGCARATSIMIGTTLEWLLKYGLLLIVVCTAASKLTDVNSFSAFAIFSPVFFCVGCVCCSTSLTALTVTPEDLQEAEAHHHAETSQMNREDDDDSAPSGSHTGNANDEVLNIPPPAHSIEDQTQAPKYGATDDSSVALNIT
ncbi:DnaJ protein-like [Hondaea fermentalgiana]|uniref:DnaJ protein-like n=1 Tax=Hondaea fermentalgiana TaxID=2315210 RepID=A0A2R5H1F3_9STRA|nr:DnaJ protein-like [Hondaea fermentalgiana]|eukprot:GBG34631.1 DnaJ protein-like [Hondaea fermentalgiana]